MVLKSSLSDFKIMGVINITPDSFSDGGEFEKPDVVLRRAKKLIELGADFIDIGAESTRPGADPVEEKTEWDRLYPVLRLLKEHNLIRYVTVDTLKHSIMDRLVEFPIAGVNDVSGTCPKEILSRLKSSGVKYHMSMHMHKNPKVMQNEPLNAENAVSLVDLFFEEKSKKLLDCGYEPNEFWLDPGLGFGKSDAANILLMSKISEWKNKFQIGVGISRKSMLGRILQIEFPAQRDDASKMLELGLLALGASLIRTHWLEPLVRIKKILSSG